ncbi:MAG: MerR family transcriptional regulator [Spirochaetes bacterium]|nr:MerR family transcriptional regulator [Spirochaetota bacterium]
MKQFENEKIYYSIKEVCDLLDIKPYTLRNWENFIPFLSPKKNRFGHRIYSKIDIEKIEIVKKLLYEKKYTFKGVLDLFIKYNGDITKFNIGETNIDKKITNFKINKNKVELWNDIIISANNIKKLLDKKI